MRAVGTQYPKPLNILCTYGTQIYIDKLFLPIYSPDGTLRQFPIALA